MPDDDHDVAGEAHQLGLETLGLHGRMTRS
jgi:hypothetical protein